jgi:hypothetical protein
MANISVYSCLIIFFVLQLVILYYIHLHQCLQSPVPTQTILPNRFNEDIVDTNEVIQQSIRKIEFQGVACNIMLHSPKWFQFRYTTMILNIKNNIPKDWAIQIFYIPNGGSQAGLDLNPGLMRIIDNQTIFLTEIPEYIYHKKGRNTEYYLESWLWESMLADKVLIFGGNSAFCSNSLFRINDFVTFDYIGSPWPNYRGRGGRGEISIRNRNLMLYILNEEKRKLESNYDIKTLGMEDDFFVSRIVSILKSQSENISTYPNPIRISSIEDSKRFSSANEYMTLGSMTGSGIMSQISYDDREVFLQYCIELKIIFPSLHDPHCFGATPNATKCANSICALKPDRKGGC